MPSPSGIIIPTPLKNMTSSELGFDWKPMETQMETYNQWQQNHHPGLFLEVTIIKNQTVKFHDTILLPIGSVCMQYMVTFTINTPQMLASIYH